MEKRRVVITGVGVIAPNGIGVKHFWDSLSHGRSGVRGITHFDASSYASQVAGEVDGFDPLNYMDSKSARRMDRFAQFAAACTRMALEDANFQISNKNSERVGIALGSALGGIPSAENQHSIFMEKGLNRVDPLLAIKIFPGGALAQISVEFGIRGHSNTISSACAAGTDSVGYAFYAIENNLADVMITGGAEAPIVPLTFGAFCLIGALSTRNGDPAKASRPYDKERNGFVMGEGAGILTLESLEHAIERNAHIYAEVLSYGTTNDAYHMAQPLPTGEQAIKSVEVTLQRAKIDLTEIDYINAHGSSTILNDKTETRIIKQVFGQNSYKIPISSNKSMIGHALGAAGSIELVASVLTIENGFIPPTINYEFPDPECDLDYVPNEGRRASVITVLKNSFGFGGKNSNIVIRKYM